MTNEPIDGERLVSWAATPINERWVWLLTAMATTSIVYLTYVVTHPYPAYAGGLYLQIAEEIIQNNYALPTRIPGYTQSGVPFAYPPLMFYVTALLMDFGGVEPLVLVRYLPGLVVIAYLIPYYGIAEELLSDPRKAGLATLLLGLTPTVLRWHLSAGGLVRAPAYLLALTGIYTGLKLFTSHDRRWLLASTVIFGLMVLTHPTYTVFFVLSYLLIYGAVDRSVKGFLAGAVVGFGGLLISAPWWGQIVVTHGVSIFSTAAGTHGGLGGGPYRLAAELTYALDNLDIEWPFYIGAFLGGAYYLHKQRYFLPVWMITASYVIGKSRFLFVAGSMLTAAFVFEGVVPKIQQSGLSVEDARTTATVAVALVVLTATIAGILFGASAVQAAHEQSNAQPAYMDETDHEAMEWIERNTGRSAAFVVLSDAAEWLPYFTDRTIIVGPWGVEWKTTAGYYDQMALYDAIAACDDASCVTAWLDRENLEPDYLYVPKDHYTVRGREHVQSAEMRASLVESNRYEVVFENDGVIVARVVDRPDSQRGHADLR